jgi:hypothetical protein
MAHRRSNLVTGAAVLVLVALAAETRADAIDGDWCNAAGKRMSIRGPDLVTPGGTRMKGDYSRHFFSYVVPPGEAGAGRKVDITLLSEYLAHAREGGADAPAVEWRRCQPGIS